MKKIPDKYAASCVTYLYPAFYNRRENLRKATTTLKTDCATFDTIVCTGVSGVLFASPLALLMKKNLVIVRKNRDGSHSGRKVEANCASDEVGKWIFVDDLVDSGATLKRVKSEMKLWSDAATYLGDYLYEMGRFENAE